MARRNMKLRRRCRWLWSGLILTTVTGLLWGLMETGAAADTTAAGRPNAHHAIFDRKIDPQLSPAQRARLLRQGAIKRKQDAKKYVQNAAEERKKKASASESVWGGGQ